MTNLNNSSNKNTVQTQSASLSSAKKRTDYHGLLLIDKPSGLTSHDVVSRVRRLASTKEVGHSGTLDPLASGLMVVLLGEATKLSSIVTEGDKGYIVELQLGIETDTLDSTGEVLSKKPVSVSEDHVLDVALKLKGTLSLPIPLYSAKKIDGQKLYEYARSGEAVTIPEKEMIFWGIEQVTAFEDRAVLASENKFAFKIHCSKGSFIRSWVKLLGEKLGCGAVMTGLRRTHSHEYNLEQAQPLQKLLDLKDNSTLGEFSLKPYLTPLQSALNGVKNIFVSGHDEFLMGNGQISHDLRSQLIITFNPDQDKYIFAISRQTRQVMAIITCEPQEGFKIKRGFKY